MLLLCQRSFSAHVVPQEAQGAPMPLSRSLLTNVVMEVEMVTEFEANVDELPNTHVRGP